MGDSGFQAVDCLCVGYLAVNIRYPICSRSHTVNAAFPEHPTKSPSQRHRPQPLYQSVKRSSELRRTATPSRLLGFDSFRAVDCL